jgi:3-oxoacyl-[acyl-carrier-protein] synthase-3
MEYPAGGASNPTTADNVDDHIYYMDAREVKNQYAPAIRRSLKAIMERHPFRFEDVKRVYLHQANKYLVEAFAHEAKIPLDKLGINVDKYANTSAASTLILLDEDRKSGIVGEGDLILFLWVGAGLINGGALVRL